MTGEVAAMREDKLNIAWKDLTDEMWREYLIGDEQWLSIHKPSKLYVRPSGAHNVVDSDGRVWYIPAGWKAIRWKVYPGKPVVAF